MKVRGDREELRQRILATVDSIPRGAVATYGQVAREAGLPRHARLVGRILRELPSGSRVPWQRVLNAAGRVSARSDGSDGSGQLRRLAREGVRPGPRGSIDLVRHGWRPFEAPARRGRGTCTAPARALTGAQRAAARARR